MYPNLQSNVPTNEGRGEPDLPLSHTFYPLNAHFYLKRTVPNFSIWWKVVSVSRHCQEIRRPPS